VTHGFLPDIAVTAPCRTPKTVGKGTLYLRSHQVHRTTPVPNLTDMNGVQTKVCSRPLSILILTHCLRQDHSIPPLDLSRTSPFTTIRLVTQRGSSTSHLPPKKETTKARVKDAFVHNRPPKPQIPQHFLPVSHPKVPPPRRQPPVTPTVDTHIITLF
jgi:hypothetical protein